MYYVYIVQCRDKTFYTGITTDIERRLEEHNSSKLGARYTSFRRPVNLAYAEKFDNRSEASKEEMRIKKLNKSEKIKLIEKYGSK
ncbi:MAG: Endo/excinuclease amino terminal protein [uncultured bacterium]|nr:MAG: Endo/excinuclease amino terminal protein [uncultured bacterium]